LFPSVVAQSLLAPENIPQIGDAGTQIANITAAAAQTDPALIASPDTTNIVGSIVSAGVATAATAGDINRNLLGSFELTGLLQNYQGPQNFPSVQPGIQQQPNLTYYRRPYERRYFSI